MFTVIVFGFKRHLQIKIYDNRVKRDITFDNCLEVPIVGRSGGLMLLWNNDVDANVQPFLASHIDIVKIVNSMWSGHGNIDANEFCKISRFCLEKLAYWNHGRLNGSLKGGIARKEQEIQEISNQALPNWHYNMIKVEKELEQFSEEEEIYWKQRSRED
ncbi:unnamed protein product [Citrullus colocynthis]|uniref:Uncharacterized protein n=1 Tax=Citrullus colocynthis TaxID=252529 RepID=A0ABP0ZF25_9ROSI